MQDGRLMIGGRLLILALAGAIASWLVAEVPHATVQTPAPPGAVTLRQEAVWRIEPSTITCQPGETVQFTSFVPDSYQSYVTWSATGGAITPQGLYTAAAAAGDYYVYATLTATGLRARARVTVTAQQETTTHAADRLVDSIGVNIHLHYDDTIYRRDFALTKARLLELGVRHVRDGLIDTSWQPYYERHNELGRSGIRTIFIVPVEPDPALLRAYPLRVADAFEGFEAPNEYDASRDPDWAARLRASLAALQGTKTVPSLARFPVIGPSLTTEAAYDVLGDISGSVDMGNMHNYFAGHHPGTTGWSDGGYGSIEWNKQLARRVSGTKPLVTTESGYATDPAVTDSIPETVAGKYLPRLLLEQFRLGVTRTYLYELADERGQPGSYGLLTADGGVKPAFSAIARLVSLLSDPGPAHTTTPLGYTLSGGSDAVRSISFQRRDGRYFLFVWLERPSYDPAARRAVAVDDETVTVTLRNARLTGMHRWQPDGSLVSAAAQGTQSAVRVSDTLLALELQP